MNYFYPRYNIKQHVTLVNSSEFTKRLQKILKEYGLTATAFAEEIDFNRSTISHLLSGRNKPSLEFVLKVVERFPDVNLYWLLNGKGNFPASASTSEKEISKPPIVHSSPISNSPSEENFASIPSEEKSAKSQNDVDRIVIFYKNGSFKEYLP